MDRGNDPKPSSRAEKRLTALEVKAFADRAEVGKKLIDGGGLMLVVLKSGSSSWRIRYWIDSKEKTYSVGTYPAVTLEAAREALANVRKRIKFGDDPVKARQVEVAARIVASGTTFEAVTQEWLKLRRKDWGDDHYSRSERALERDVLPTLGKLPVADITPAMVSGVVTKIAERGVRETAKKILQNINWIFRYACANGLRNDNPAPPAIEMLPKKAKRKDRLPALLSFLELGEVLRAADAARISPAIRMAHRLIAFTAARIGNAVEADWKEFDLDAEQPIWTIPRSKMKAQDRYHDHRIFLSPTIADELRRWKRTTGGKGPLFPSNTGEGVITRDGIEKAYRVTLGLRDKHCPHGWRSALSTLGREEGNFEHDVIDLALDHIHDDEVARAYDRGERLAKRVKLMNWWGAQLDSAQHGADVVTMPTRAA
ncbi:MAG: integrase arm-type DNA-binding domain-containing protein [Proteobacteria bacterium]|nr:integrase arm-type DNA-binding domain-containing protein [Pseudomonadota bacterium]